jgi:hypothetical protein
MSNSLDDLANDSLNYVYAQIWSDKLPLNEVKRVELLLGLAIAASLSQIERRLGKFNLLMHETIQSKDGGRTSKDADPPHNGVLEEEIPE